MTAYEAKRYNEYPYIAAWGTYLGSNAYYIVQQIRDARYDNAPKTAIYKDTDTGRWVTFEECKNKSALIFMGKFVQLLTQE